MKKITLLLLFTFAISIVNAQRLTKVYIGPTIHDGEIGGSVVGSFGINKYLGAGIGVDASKYMDKILVPIYVDVRAHLPLNKWSPFAFAQTGIGVYQNNDYIEKGTVFGVPYQVTADVQGRLFYGGGAGVSYALGPIGIFAHYTFRSYQFNYDYVNGGMINDQNKSKGTSIITAGIVF